MNLLNMSLTFGSETNTHTEEVETRQFEKGWKLVQKTEVEVKQAMEDEYKFIITMDFIKDN
jgi:hypothetical protein